VVAVHVLLFLLLSLILIHFRKPCRDDLLLVLSFASLVIGPLESSVTVFSILKLVLEVRVHSPVGIILVIYQHHLSLHILGSVCASLLLHASITGVGSEQTVGLFADFDVFILYTKAPEEGTHQIVRIRT
jgi:hypothetical protein